MSIHPSDSDNSDDLEEALESTRRNVRQLEMDTCRVRNDLTRLEVALESGIANRPRATRSPYEQRTDDRLTAQPLVRVEDEADEPVATELDPFGAAVPPTLAPDELPLTTILPGAEPETTATAR